MKRFSYISLLCILLAIPSLSYSATTKGGYFACLTKETLDEMTGYTIANDLAGANYLRENLVCFIPQKGLRVGIIKRKWGIKKIRLYAPNGTSLVIWTYSEAIQQ